MSETVFQPGNQAAKGRGPNKVSTKVKEAIVKFLEDNVEQIQESFDKLKPGDKLRFIADILPYAAPKMQSIQADIHSENEWHVTLNINGAKDQLHPPLGSDVSAEDN